MLTKKKIDQITQALAQRGYIITRVDDESELVVLVIDPMSPALFAIRRFPLKSSGKATLVVEKSKK